MDSTLTDLRPFTMGDLPKLTKLILQAGAYPPTGPFTAEDLLTRWERWRVNPEQDVNVLPDKDGALIAFSRATLVTEPSLRVAIELAVRPDKRMLGIGSALYNLIESRTRRLQVLHVTSPVFLKLNETQSDFADFLLKREFFPDRSYWQMRLDDLAAQPKAEWPIGVAYRKLVPNIGDAERWAAMVREIFGEPATAARLLAQIAEPGHNPDGYIFAVDQATGREIGACRARIDLAGGERIGYVGTVGVLPQYRHRGVATALILQTLRYLAEQDLSSAVLFVENENHTARRLYETLGWRDVYRTVHYWKRLP